MNHRLGTGAKHVFRRIVPGAVRRRIRPPRPPWVVATPAPASVQPLGRFGFYAVIGTWMESDVVGDTVANAYAQGVDRVLLVDNGSPDDTIARSIEAGAEHVLTYRTSRFEERYRITLMNEIVRHFSVTSEFDHVWWLWLDADEFPRPEGSGTLRDELVRLDGRYRVVGARVLNHYPSPGGTGFVPGTHPVEHQPLCEEVPQHICASMHRKHPLQRWDRHGVTVEAGLGFHRAESAERPLYEPTTPIVLHHVPFREETFTRRRLEVLWQSTDGGGSRALDGDIATDHMKARLESLDAVYSGDWSHVRNFIPGRPALGIDLVDWRSLVPRIHPELPSWCTSPTRGR